MVIRRSSLGNLPNQRLGPGGLARTGRPGHQDVLAAAHRQTHEGLVLAAASSRSSSRSVVVERCAGAAGAAEYPALRQLLDGPHLIGRAADGDGDAAGGGRGRQHDLHALAAGQRCRQQRRGRVDSLLRRICDQLGEATAPVEIRKRQRFAVPAVAVSTKRFVRAIDADFRDVRIASSGRSARSVRRERGGVRRLR